MSILDKFRHKPDTSPSSPNPSSEEYQQLLQQAQGPGTETASQQEREASRRDILQAAADSGRVILSNSEASGEVPIITPGMERPSESTQSASEQSPSDEDSKTPANA